MGVEESRRFRMSSWPAAQSVVTTSACSCKKHNIILNKLLQKEIKVSQKVVDIDRIPRDASSAQVGENVTGPNTVRQIRPYLAVSNVVTATY